MKTISVVPADGMIIVDGVSVKADFSVSENIHAIQWNEGKGHIEYVQEPHGQRVVPFSEEKYGEYVAPFVALWEEKIHGEMASPLSIGELAEMRHAEIIAGADEHMTLFKTRYSCCEEGTWPLQEAGARIILDCERLTKNSQSFVFLAQDALRERAVQLVAELAAERGIRPETMAERIVARADNMALYSQLIFAEQRKFSRLVDKLVAVGSEERIRDMVIAYTTGDQCMMN